MILGLEVRHFKTYKGQKYIPITKPSERLSTFIGNNGIGKSSILEALDVLFNSKEWNINLEAKNERGLNEKTRNQPYIMGLFLVEKSKIKDKQLKVLCESITSCLIQKSSEKNNILNSIYKINKDINFENNYFALIVGKQYNNNNIDTPYFGAYDKDIKEIIRRQNNINEEPDSSDVRAKNKSNRLYDSYFNDILAIYTYIYIPTEVNISEFSRIEKLEIQKLTGKNINKEIEKIISETSLKNINDKLILLVNNISNELKNYEFDTKSNQKNIQMSSLVSKIIEEFFSLRVLIKKSDKDEKVNVKYLSSGEKRKALIDLSKAFLKAQENDEKYIIFSVDEPEASLSTNARFKQFKELNEIKNINTNIQILISTHWYGHLSIQGEGMVHLLYMKENEINIDTYDLYNFREKINQIKKNNINDLPNDITLKSVNDLTQSIISSLQTDIEYNWLICEGTSEKIYFDYYFNDLINNNNLIILPVGGAKEVKRIYEHLELPLRDYKSTIKGKIFCLIDTDKEKFGFTPNNYNNNNLVFKRLLNNNDKTNLVDNNHNINTPTEIEDCLEGKIYINVLNEYNNVNIRKILKDKQNIKDLNLNSFYCFDLRAGDKNTIKSFFDKDEGYRKIDFAKRYTSKAITSSFTPQWIEEIREFFCGKKVIISLKKEDTIDLA